MIYISSDESEEMSEEWDSDWSTDTEKMIKRIDTDVVSSPKLIAGRIMTSNSHEDLALAPGPSSSRTNLDSTPKLDEQYFDSKLCLASTKEGTKRRIELCKTRIPVADTPISPPSPSAYTGDATSPITAAP